ncbi:class I SAM-dependent methyltransferase [Hyphococcus formosus]|uniref:class I SAM-dependent methyltransferase n=1 Tax=Hyphococcus formosus TaxID=3143534 RepID=UPI00398AD6A3
MTRKNTQVINPVEVFDRAAYQAINEARLSHLAKMLSDIGVSGEDMSVLELGAGVGDHTDFWLNRGAKVTVTDGRAENLAIVKSRFPSIEVCQLDLDNGLESSMPDHDIVYAYGILYHLRDPAAALAYMADKCRRFLFLETCVNPVGDMNVLSVNETAEDPSQAMHGVGCRPSRRWIFEELKQYFPYVYQPSYQPEHEQFPLAWADVTGGTGKLARSIFVAAREPIDAGTFFPHLLETQVHVPQRHSQKGIGIDNFLKSGQFGLIIDVGANKGQFAANMRRLGYEGPIVSFEPLSSAFAKLRSSAEIDGNIRPFNFALGDKEAIEKIYISGNSASTSFLPLEERTVHNEPLTGMVGEEIVEVKRFDDLSDEVFSQRQDGPVLLKLDTQGTERQVLSGASDSLDKIDFILSECSLVSVYKGEPLVEDQIRWMREKGFDPISMGLGWSSPETGETFQIDILFKRRK